MNSNQTRSNKPVAHSLKAVLLKAKIAKGLIAPPEYDVRKPIADPAAWSKEHMKLYKIFNSIANECQVRGLLAECVPPSFMLNEVAGSIEGNRVEFAPHFKLSIPAVPHHGISVELDEEHGHSHSSWRSGPALGTYSVYVRGIDGDSMKKRRFPSNKNGHNYEKIADLLAVLVGQRLAERKVLLEKAATVDSNKSIVEKLKAEFGLNEYDDTVCASYGYRTNGGYGRNSQYKELIAPTGQVFLKLGTMTVTEAQARSIMLAINAVMKGE